MEDHRQIRVDLVKRGTGERRLRLSEDASGLSLEKRLDPRQPVVHQKERLMRAFEAALARELTSPA